MSMTLLLTWDIRPNMEQDYFQFIVSEWLPATTRLGLQVAAAWYTQYRESQIVPMIRAEIVTPDIDSMRQALASEDWLQLQENLDKFVLNYKQKVVETNGEFQL